MAACFFSYIHCSVTAKATWLASDTSRGGTPRMQAQAMLNCKSKNRDATRQSMHRASDKMQG
jgi:hypothetical protein